jgi:hypothetical protein
MAVLALRLFAIFQGVAPVPALRHAARQQTMVVARNVPGRVFACPCTRVATCGRRPEWCRHCQSFTVDPMSLEDVRCTDVRS